MVAVRGLAPSLHSHFGFETAERRAGRYRSGYGWVPRRQSARPAKRMINALETIPGVESAGLSNWMPLGVGADDSHVFTDKTTDLRPGNAAADVELFKVSPEYFRAAGTALLV